MKEKRVREKIYINKREAESEKWKKKDSKREGDVK